MQISQSQLIRTSSTSVSELLSILNGFPSDAVVTGVRFQVCWCRDETEEEESLRLLVGVREEELSAAQERLRLAKEMVSMGVSTGVSAGSLQARRES